MSESIEYLSMTTARQEYIGYSVEDEEFKVFESHSDQQPLSDREPESNRVESESNCESELKDNVPILEDVQIKASVVPRPPFKKMAVKK